MQYSAPHHPEDQAPPGPLSVLLVEGSGEAVSTFSTHLREGAADATLRYEQTPEEVRSLLRDDRPDVLVLGCGLSESDVSEAVASAAQAVPPVPVVMLASPNTSTAVRPSQTETEVKVLQTDALTQALVEHTIQGMVERNRLRRQVRQRETLLQSISESVRVGTFRATPDGHIRSVDEAFVQMLGVDCAADVTGLNLPTLVADPTRDDCLDAAAEEDGVEILFERGDGSIFTGLLNVEAARGADGTVRHYDGTIVDITERKERKKRLRLLSKAVEQAGEAVIITEGAPLDDPGPRIQYVNDAFEEMSGYAEEDLLGKTPRILQGPATDQTTLDSVRAALEAGEEWQGEAVNYRKDGTPYIVQWNLSPVVSEDGTIEHWMSIQRDVTEQRKQAKQLRQQRNLLEQTQRLAGAWRLDLRTGAQTWSDEVFQIFEIEPGTEIDLEETLDFFDSEARSEIQQALRQCAEENEPYDLELPMRTAQGTRRWIRTVGAPSKIEDGEVTELAGAIQDITERKETEQELERAKGLLRRAGEMAQLGGWSVDVSGEPPYQAQWTEGLYDLFELPHDTDPPTEDVFEYYHPDDRDRHRAAVERAVETGTGWDQEIRLITAEGTKRWVRNIGEVITEEGEVVEIQGAVQDITDQKQVEEELRWTKRYYEQILNQVPIDLAVFTPDAEFEYLNPKSVPDPEMREWLRGRTNVDYCRRRGLDLEMGRRRDEAIRKAARQDMTLQIEETIDTGSGPHHYLRVHSPVRDLDGEITNVVAFGLDITDRKKKEQRLREAKEEAEEAARLKSAMLANMSHEIRTPLTSILGFAEAIGDEVGDGESVDAIDLDSLARFSDLIQQSGRRLMETLDGVLNLSRLEAGEMDLSPTTVDLTDEVEETAAQFAPQAQEAGVTLDVQMNTPAVWARADAGGLQIVLRNLLSNAIKYTEEGGRVTVSVRSEDEAILEVKDTGIGMNPEQTDQLFEAFKQASDGISREYEGTGLGLTVTKEVIDRMGGSIEVETEQGVGSCFTVRLPPSERRTAKDTSKAD